MFSVIYEKYLVIFYFIFCKCSMNYLVQINKVDKNKNWKQSILFKAL